MLMVAIALMQAAAPEATPSPTPTAVAEVSADVGVEEPKMKRVCRKVIDPRVNTLAARQTVCKFVPIKDEVAKR